MIRIIVDDREKNSNVPKELERLGVTIEYKHLPIGDYIPLPELVVERKSMQDLINSIYDGRLFIQSSNMLKHYEKILIIIEYENIIDNPLVIYGALASLVWSNISLINSYSERDTACILFSLAKRKSILDKPLLKKIKKGNTLYEQQLSILLSLPGIGEKNAIKLLQRFGSPAGVINANISELAKVIGYTRASKLRDVLSKQFIEREERFDKHWFSNEI